MASFFRCWTKDPSSGIVDEKVEVYEAYAMMEVEENVVGGLTFEQGASFLLTSK